MAYDRNFENVLNASKLANIHDHIMNLPNEYSTYLGKAGSSLSGGQKQRIAIARALYKNPQIVIFDEATSQLDVPTERQVFESIKSIKNKITVNFQNSGKQVIDVNHIILEKVNINEN